MDANATDARIETLLADSAWLSALARRLVRDPATADDLVQDTWRAALSSPTRGDRGWLATVLTNFARARARSDKARVERERRTARAERIEGPDRLVERAESQRKLLAHVLALEEPYRSTLLARYVDGQSAAEIARRTGVIESTVRTRLSRALEQLRARLASEHREDRMLGIGALLQDSGVGSTTGILSTVASVGIGAWIMGTTTKIAIATTVLICAWLAWRYEQRDVGELELGSTAAAQDSVQAVTSPESASRREALEPANVATSASVADPVAAVAEAPAAPAPTATLEILFTRNGSPVPGITVWLIPERNAGWSRWAKNPVMFIDLLDFKFVWPSDSPKAISDSRGLASFRDLPVALYFVGFSTNSSERPTHLGIGNGGLHTNHRHQIRLGSASIHGVVYDDLGRTRAGVGVSASGRAPDPVGYLNQYALCLTDERGAFRIDDLRDTDYDVVMEPDGHFDGRGEVQQTAITLHPDEDRELNFGSDLPSPRWTGRLLNAFGEPFPGTARLSLESEKNSGNKLSAQVDIEGKFQVAFSPGTWRVKAFAAGSPDAGFYLGAVELPNAEVLRDLVIPGSRLQGRVLPAVDGDELPKEILVALHPKEHFEGWALRDATVTEDGRYQIDGLEPGTWVFDVYPGTLQIPVEVELREGQRSLEQDLRWIAH